MRKAPAGSFAAFSRDCKIESNIRGGRLKTFAGPAADLLEHDLYPADMALLRAIAYVKPKLKPSSRDAINAPRGPRSYSTFRSVLMDHAGMSRFQKLCDRRERIGRDVIAMARGELNEREQQELIDLIGQMADKCGSCQIIE